MLACGRTTRVNEHREPRKTAAKVEEEEAKMEQRKWKKKNRKWSSESRRRRSENGVETGRRRTGISKSRNAAENGVESAKFFFYKEEPCHTSCT